MATNKEKEDIMEQLRELPELDEVTISELADILLSNEPRFMPVRRVEEMLNKLPGGPHRLRKKLDELHSRKK
jgi:hypothetical protein